MNQGELELLNWLVSRHTGHDHAPSRRQEGSRVDIGLGDDMAAIRLADGGTVLIGSDSLVAVTHFDPTIHSLDAIGRKALLSCLSDCAAMAVRPIAALVSLIQPRGEVFQTGKTLLESIIRAAEEYDCQIVGGDTTSWAGPLAIDITVVAQPWPGIAPIRRRGAKPGDLIYVTGLLGGSILGRHMSFRPRIHEAKEIANLLKTDLHAMIDISDGLSLDLHRVCAASCCGCIIDHRQLSLVVSPDAHKLAQQDGQSPEDHALSDGEDYELLLAVSPEAEKRLRDLKLDLFPIGRFTTQGFRLQKTDGELIDLQPRGYVH